MIPTFLKRLASPVVDTFPTNVDIATRPPPPRLPRFAPGAASRHPIDSFRLEWDDRPREEPEDSSKNDTDLSCPPLRRWVVIFPSTTNCMLLESVNLCIGGRHTATPSERRLGERRSEAMVSFIRIVLFFFGSIVFNARPCQSLSISSATSVATTSHTWMYQGKHPIAYEMRRDSSAKEEDKGEVLLLLNGFGMGTFHQHRLMNELLPSDASSAASYNTLYAMDYLGQGKSWPVDCADGMSPSEYGLQYSGQTWVDQILQFIEEVVLVSSHPPRQVHLVGNSVGGYLATYVAAIRPDRVATVSLLNATPVWGLNLPGWSGHLPAPFLPQRIGRFLFDRMRDRNNIEQFLRTTYVHPTAYDEELIQQIRACTEGPGGHAAFASILWSPPVSVEGIETLYDGLEKLQCDVLLLFGRDDPWCQPAFARKMLLRLQQRPSADTARYVEIADVGHCPHHEAPRATAQVLQSWCAATRPGRADPQWFRPPRTVHEAWGATVVQARVAEEIPVRWMDQIAVRLL
jgi:pimeloyl-ACP methyl ester carboxylesterase